MKYEEIKCIINKALMEEFEFEEEMLVPDARLREDLQMDSLDMVDFVIVIEQAFGFKLPDRSAIQHIRTLGDIYNFIDGLQGELVKNAGD